MKMLGIVLLGTGLAFFGAGFAIGAVTRRPQPAGRFLGIGALFAAAGMLWTWFGEP